MSGQDATNASRVPGDNGSTAALQAASRGSIPRGSTNFDAISQGEARRFSADQRGFDSLWRHQVVARSTLGVARAHNPVSDRVRIPCALPTPGSSNGRASVLQTDDGGSNPSPGTISTVGEGKRCAARP
jgi:hypothetical protein